MRFALMPLAYLIALAACESPDPAAPDAAMPDVNRIFANTFSDQPFDTGAVTVLTTENGTLRSYTLTQCGDTVCAGSRRGSVEETPEFTIISGTHAGRVFYLSAGGGGFLKRNDEMIPLAWEDPKPASIFGPTGYPADESDTETAG